MNEFVHHYTSIETLRLILANIKIRFTRLDRVDDILEGKLTGTYELSKYVFTSCWTIDKNESIPQWNMYAGKMKGVIITFPKDMFNYQPLIPSSRFNFSSDGIVCSPIKIDELFTDDYIIISIFTKKDNLERKVIYVEDHLEKAKEFVKFDVDNTGYIKNFKINSILELAVYKSLDWEFQKELRFVIFLLPGIPIPPRGINDKVYSSELPNHMMNCILKHVPPKLNYFDIELSEIALNNIKVTMGPLTTPKDFDNVKSLLEQNTTNGTIEQSRLHGKIRAKHV